MKRTRKVLRQLQCRLALLFTAVAGMILCAALYLSWTAAADQLRQKQMQRMETFMEKAEQVADNSINGTDQELQAENLAQDLKFSLGTKVAAQHLCLLCTVYFDGEVLASMGEENLRTPLEILRKNMSGTFLDCTGVNSVKGARDDTYGYIRRFVDVHSGGSVTLTLIKDTHFDNDEKRQTDLFYLFITLGGLILMLIFSYLLMGLALRPVKQNMRRQKEFIAAASHELKSPLSVMKAVLPLLPEEEHAAILEQETDRMTHLVGDLLTLAGKDGGSWTVCKQPVDTDTLLAEIYDSFLPITKKAGMEFLLDLPYEPLPPLLGDKERLNQILHILLDNAVSYGMCGKRISVGVRPAGRNLRLWVSDHGPGIPPQERKAVFGRFYRTSQSRTDKTHFGLGLSVAKELTALHGGSIWAEETPGGGATFVVLLPCAAGKRRLLSPDGISR